MGYVFGIFGYIIWCFSYFIFYIKVSIYLLFEIIVVPLVLGCFSDKSIFNFYISEELTKL